jgi:hypothetical protein
MIFRKTKALRQELQDEENAHIHTSVLLQEERDAHTIAFQQIKDESNRAFARKELQIVDLNKTIDGLRMDLAHAQGRRDEASAHETEASQRYAVLTAHHSFHIGGKIECHGNEPVILWTCQCGVQVAAPAGFF